MENGKLFFVQHAISIGRNPSFPFRINHEFFGLIRLNSLQFGLWLLQHITQHTSQYFATGIFGYFINENDTTT